MMYLIFVYGYYYELALGVHKEYDIFKAEMKDLGFASTVLSIKNSDVESFHKQGNKSDDITVLVKQGTKVWVKAHDKDNKANTT